MAGDYEETLDRLAKHLGRNVVRRQVFKNIYGKVSKPRSLREIMKAAGIKDQHKQQVQNALDHLHKHSLIGRADNKGTVKDGSHYVYKKEPSIRAHKDRIIWLADHKRDAAKIATKRKPHVGGTTVLKTITRQAVKKKKVLQVLYLTANSDDHNVLRVEAEMRQVQDAVRGSAFRDHVALHYRPAADMQSIVDGLNDHRPTVVHFSGHGNSSGIAVDSRSKAKHHGKLVSYKFLADALSATDDPPDVIVLNSCESAGARKDFLPPAKIIIVMGDSISDQAASLFSAFFYAAIAAGQSVKSAFKQATNAIEHASLSEYDTPELHCAPGVDPGKLILT